MRKKIVAGNWKMNLDFDDARSLFSDIRSIVFKDERIEVIIAPPAPYLSQFASANISSVSIAAQNCHFEANGAFTGEISSSMIASLKIPYALVGHSERRQMFGDTDEVVSKKVKSIADAGVVPILCCGELLEERKAGKQSEVVNRQIMDGISRLDASDLKKLVIAYEPVWAIGTGETASPDQAQDMHAFIRNLFKSMHGEAISESIRILYGGSVKPANAKELFNRPDIDGGLVGGASLKYDSFKAIIEAAQ